MKHKVILDGFEGPLDLLISLIEKSKVDIYDIPINNITEQYMLYIYEMEELDLEIASDFLIMASTLLQIKSKMLLPVEKILIDGEEVELDPRDELVLQILSYKTFKEAAEQLRNAETKELMTYYKPKEDLSIYEEDTEIGPFEISKLLKAINNIFNRQNSKNNSLEISEIKRDEYSIKECLNIVVEKLKLNNSLKFSDLLNLNTSKNEVIAFFLSILELSKMGYVYIKQDMSYTDLYINRLDLGENSNGINRIKINY